MRKGNFTTLGYFETNSKGEKIFKLRNTTYKVGDIILGSNGIFL